MCVTFTGMSRHWQPEEDRTRWARADGLAPRKLVWPQGATPGLLLVASGCLAIAVLLYKATGPRDMIEKNSAIDWNKVELPPQR